MVDRYTKFVLSVIAVALCAIALETAISQATAQVDTIQKVQICDQEHCANLLPIIPHGTSKEQLADALKNPRLLIWGLPQDEGCGTLSPCFIATEPWSSINARIVSGMP
jgi:hypothetical protein